jgi:hypothetical protein
MKLPSLALVPLAAVLVACGGKVVVDAPAGTGGAGGSGSSSTSASSTSVSTSGGVCPPHASAGCCFGDGMCCDCVSSTVCTLGTFGPITAEVTAFDDCVCGANVCGSSCVAACAGQGIDMNCQQCAAKAAQGPCASTFSACPTNTSGG